MLHKSKHGKLPTEFMKACPKEAALIQKMLSSNPQERPCISELRNLFNNGEICQTDGLIKNSPLNYSI